jgi:hypothetical protein
MDLQAFGLFRSSISMRSDVVDASEALAAFSAQMDPVPRQLEVRCGSSTEREIGSPTRLVRHLEKKVQRFEAALLRAHTNAVRRHRRVKTEFQFPVRTKIASIRAPTIRIGRFINMNRSFYPCRAHENRVQIMQEVPWCGAVPKICRHFEFQGPSEMIGGSDYWAGAKTFTPAPTTWVGAV